MIDSFDGKYAFLSNFYPATVEYGGIKYQNSEAAYQAQKTIDDTVMRRFATLSPEAAKRMGRSIQLRPDWEQVKDDIMLNVCRCKFRQHPDLARELVETGNEELIEGNTWDDTCWGVCNGVGENRLGKILMRIRDELRKAVD